MITYKGCVYMDTFLEWVMFIAIIYLDFKMIQLQEDLKSVTYKIEQIAKKVQVPENPINDDLRDLLKDGKDVEAVKLARETLGLSLVEGKQYIDSLKSDDT